MATVDNQDFEQEIKEIMFDRIITVSQELHQKGLRWGDMFSEEDNRAIETFTIETFGETVQEAAEREDRKREMDRRRREMSAKNDHRDDSDQTQKIETTSAEESEIVPDDPVPQPAIVCQYPEENKNDILEEPSGLSKAEFHQDTGLSEQCIRKTLESRQLQHHKRHGWRPNRMYHISMNNTWQSKNENSNTCYWRRVCYERGNWKKPRNRYFRSRSRWSDERYSHPRMSDEQSDRPHTVSSEDKLFDLDYESEKAQESEPWERTQNHNLVNASTVQRQNGEILDWRPHIELAAGQRAASIPGFRRFWCRS